MNHDVYDDTYIRGILTDVKTIAMVGISPKENRPSYFVFKYLLERGYDMIPVNPGQAGKQMLGKTFVASLGYRPPGRHGRYLPRVEPSCRWSTRRWRCRSCRA